MSTLFIRVQGPATGMTSAASGEAVGVDDPLVDAVDSLSASNSLAAGDSLIAGDSADNLQVESYELNAQWLISEADGQVRAQGESDLRGLSELIDPESDWLQNPANIVLLLPTSLVLNVSCEVPGRNPAQVRRALPFAVEEFVATDIEMMHVAAGNIQGGGTVRSQIIERTILDSWLAALHSIGIRPGYAFSDAEMLPGSRGHSTLLFDGDEVLMKNQHSAACVDSENLEFVLGAFIEAVGEAATGEAVIETINGEIDPLSLAQLPSEVEFSATTLDASQSVLGYLAGLWHSRGPLADNAINLLQGDYSVRMNASGEASRWRTVVMVAAAWFGIALLGLVVRGFYSDSQAGGLKTASEALYKDIYADAQRIPPNIQRDMQFRMGEGGASGGEFVPLIGQLSEHISQDIAVRSFNFQGSRDELSTELVVSEFPALDALKEKLTGSGLAVEVSSADQQSDGVHARLRLRYSNAQ